ncbi:triose-phosphate isomerase [candidate division WWE3 bacterium]|uniref:Triosephosphate isomerase n=1 Tax=candidate division WWE3 bacterium TaxID=2053526 RepID=A0A928Y6B0_UNCKA|nr:triose-phosphate isomerase [candidate division WWE3 bacterium]
MNKLIIANWKMYYGPVKAGAWVRAFRRERLPKDLDIGIAVPSVSLAAARASLGRATIPALCAQNVFWEKEGAYTGEISPTMLVEFGVSLCLVGHSERRRYLGETDDMTAKKAAALQKAGIVPVVCVGETEVERKKKQTKSIIKKQVAKAVADLKPDGRAPAVIAYEPVWAIGSGKPCDPVMAKEAHDVIRDVIGSAWGQRIKDEIRIIYGGSVTDRNIHAYMTTTGIDGALVGGASLDPRTFALLCRSAVPA